MAAHILKRDIDGHDHERGNEPAKQNTDSGNERVVLLFPAARSTSAAGISPNTSLVSAIFSIIIPQNIAGVNYRATVQCVFCVTFILKYDNVGWHHRFTQKSRLSGKEALCLRKMRFLSKQSPAPAAIAAGAGQAIL